ncbi:MAG TPA: thiamine-phosphate kinase [Thermoplasmata archaeon]|nr:thiamine-phosphate kinase [Thermoplasmata archaeon]
MKRGRGGSLAPIQERDFHAWLARHLGAGSSGLLPLGDDAAALPAARGRVAVLTTDSLVEGTHFLPDSRAGRVGAAAVAVSLSDLAAKGARPAAILLAVIVPPGTRTGWAQDLVRGAEQLAREFGAAVVGGDTKPGPVRTVVSTALGWAARGHLAPRSRARPSDLLVTTGVVGRGGVAAAHLGNPRYPRSTSSTELLDVRPRVREGIALARWAHAMLDTSDGLAEGTRLLASASRVRVVVEESRLPLAPGLRPYSRDVRRRRAIAFFGGDYELLAAISGRDLARAQRAVRSVGGRLTTIGRIERGRGAWLESLSGTVPMPPAAWRPFVRHPRVLS